MLLITALAAQSIAVGCLLSLVMLVVAAAIMGDL